jgi:anti-sigma B factor antagonist
VGRRPSGIDRRGLASVFMEQIFSTDVEYLDGAVVINVAGEIDIATCERLRDAIEPHLGPQQSIVLDFAGVRFMDSACLKVLIQARGRLSADGGSLVLRNPSEAARRLLSAAQAQDLLDADASEHPQTSN